MDRRGMKQVCQHLVWVFAAILGLLHGGYAQTPPPLVVISVDGMRPDYVTHADEHGLRIPTLRAFLTGGVWAEGVVGVVPTVTYPSHTTMITGVWPAEHGIVDNTIFDPLGLHPNTWYVYFNAIKVETIFQAADQAGLKTASVGWPVTVGAPIDYNIAEYVQSESIAPPVGSLFNPPNIREQLQVNVPASGDEDAVKTAEAVAILRKYKPGLLLVHLTNLDHQEHLHGPFSPEADATLEKADGQVDAIERAALANDAGARIVVVSDHGFLGVDHRVNLNVLLAQAGLIQLGPAKSGKSGASVLSWDAEAWPAGGSNAIVLRDPNDVALLRKVEAVLEKAKANPEYGIAQILTHDELVKRGGFPQAAFLVDYTDGYEPGAHLTGAVTESVPGTGMHGYLPSRVAMRSAFMARGAGIAPGRDLGVIDMRQIAPTLAEMLRVRLPAAKQPPVKYQP